MAIINTLQHSLVSNPFRIRYFFLIGLWSVYTDPHRSLIGFKAIVLLTNDSAQSTAPGPSGPQKIFSSIPCSFRKVTDIVVSNQPLTDSRHGRTENSITIAACYVGATGTNQTIWIRTNPSTGCLPHPERLSKELILIKGHLIPHDII